MSGSSVIFNVSVRLDQQTMDKLDFIADVEGIPRGRLIREIVEEWFAGVGAKGSPGLQCYDEYRSAISGQKVLSRAAFIADWKRKNRQHIKLLEGEKVT